MAHHLQRLRQRVKRRADIARNGYGMRSVSRALWVADFRERCEEGGQIWTAAAAGGLGVGCAGIIGVVFDWFWLLDFFFFFFPFSGV